ncbi:platelet endothelial cell adhesion molecule-like isoform X4 [Carcharodon carcharias]|uniref:platelet endothelial cell adhesion molecule-like isoform X4 n=1 Tax=Carcharodon carcharias TaxID=13397 RepID=UPI001B7E9DA3|nr:platelet endothelial cell adhesion molecule-like isoform X4 [Carcharodon carcharias]
MLKVTFPLLTLLLIEVNKTETQRGVSINSVKILHDPNDQRNIKEGSKITLTCSGNIVTLPGQTSQVLYLFYKGQNKDILLQNGTSDRKDSQYTIQSARASHSGYYCCVMEAGSERRESEPTFLTVQGNLQAPVLTIHPINVTVGDSTELRCTSEEIPPLTFIFYKYKDGQKSYRFHDIKSNNDFSMYQLKVTAATEKTYSCAVQGNGPLIESKHSEIVQIIVQDPFSDPVFEIEPSDTIFEGDILTIKCKVNFLPLFHGIQPKLTIVKDTTAIHIKDNATTVFSKRATANDAGEYKCMAEWKDVLKITMRQVNVTVPVSTPTLIPTPTGDNVVEGGILNLSCAVLKGSYPITYKFYKATSETPLHQITLNATTAVHRIISVNNENNGKYSCEASNTANQKPRTKKSQYIIITVKVPVSSPTIKRNPLKDVYKTGEWVTLLCHSTTGSIPITYSLFLNKRLIYSVSMSDTEPAAYNVLINETKDGGEYKCKAENEIPNLFKYSKGMNFTVKGAQWWIYALALVSVVSIAIVITVLCIRYHKQRSKNNKDKNQVDESYETCQIGSLQHNQEADSDRDHEVDYTNIRALKRNGDTLTRTDSESDCEGDYTNVTTKRKAANTHSDSSSDENNEVSYTQLDLAQPQNSNMPQKPGPTIYASILFNSYGAGVLEKSES